MKIKIRTDGNSSDEADDATRDSLFSDHTFKWTPDSTKLMLELRFDRQSLFQQRHHQKKRLWSEIAEEMLHQGYVHVTSEMCDLKYRNMLQTYKKNRIKDEQGLRSTIVWEYYDLFKNAFKEIEEGGATVPSMFCESLCDETNAAQPEHQPAHEDTTMQPAQDCVKIENTNDESREESEPALPVYKKRSFPQRRSMRVPKRPRRFSTLSTQSARIDLTNNEDGNVSSQTEKDMDSNTSVTISTQTNNPAASQVLEKLDSLTPTWLTTSELQECKIFGESIGVQLAQVKELRTRALLQLKMQELLFKAKIGILTMD